MQIRIFVEKMHRDELKQEIGEKKITKHVRMMWKSRGRG